MSPLAGDTILLHSPNCPIELHDAISHDLCLYLDYINSRFE